MAKNITTNTDTDWDQVGAGRQVFVKVTGTWGGTTITVKIQNGNSEYEAYPANSAHTVDFAHVYTMGDEDGLRLTSAGGSGADLWAQVLDA